MPRLMPQARYQQNINIQANSDFIIGNEVIIRLWKEYPSHISLETSKHYISFLPGMDVKSGISMFRSVVNEWRTYQEDVTERGKEDKKIILSSGLDVEKINKEIEDFMIKKHMWELKNSCPCCKGKTVKNCSGLVHKLLMAGGINKFVSPIVYDKINGMPQNHDEVGCFSSKHGAAGGLPFVFLSMFFFRSLAITYEEDKELSHLFSSISIFSTLLFLVWGAYVGYLCCASCGRTLIETPEIVFRLTELAKERSSLIYPDDISITINNVDGNLKLEENPSSSVNRLS